MKRFDNNELQFLVAMAIKNPSEEQKQQLLEWYTNVLDVKKLNHEADENRLYSICSYNLDLFGLEKEQIFQDMIAKANSYAFTSIRLVQQYSKIMQLFNECQIQAILLKGPILAQLLYGNISLRPSRDLDILVPKDQLLQAFELLESMGFHNMHNINTPRRKDYFFSHLTRHHIVMDNGEILVELHWKSSGCSGCSFEELADSNEMIKICGVPMKIPNRIPYLYYLMCHGTEHGYYRLRWLMDIYEFLNLDEGVDIIGLYRYFKEQHMEFVFFFTLQYLKYVGLVPKKIFELKDVLSEDISGYKSDDWKVAGKLLKMALELRECSETQFANKQSEFLHEFTEIAASKGMADVLSFKTKLSISPYEFEHHDFPDRLFFLYYIMRPLDWIWRKTPFSKDDYKPKTIRELLAERKRRNRIGS